MLCTSFSRLTVSKIADRSRNVNITRSPLSSGLRMSASTFKSPNKLSVISQLLKKRHLDPDNLAYNPPIFNLNSISKILERLFLSWLQHHVFFSLNFNQFQFVCQQHHFTETALLHPWQYFLIFRWRQTIYSDQSGYQCCFWHDWTFYLTV